MNYYEQELAKINFTGPTPATILVGSEGCVTKTLNLNAECAAALINKLVEVFILKPTAAPTVEEYKRFPTFSARIQRDRNGNQTLRVSVNGRGFSIQTNGNLPETHKDGICARTAEEVRNYVRKYGTKRQKQICGV